MLITNAVKLAARINEHFMDQTFATKVMMLQAASDCPIKDAMQIMLAEENKVISPK